jgi:hypothetical protein
LTENELDPEANILKRPAPNRTQKGLDLHHVPGSNGKSVYRSICLGAGTVPFRMAFLFEKVEGQVGQWPCIDVS